MTDIHLPAPRSVGRKRYGKLVRLITELDQSNQTPARRFLKSAVNRVRAELRNLPELTERKP